MNVLESDITLFKDGFAKEPYGVVSMLDYFLMIRTGYWEESVDRYRNAELSRKKRIKNLNPLVTPSGVFNAKNDGGLVGKHSGIIVLDLDKKDNPNIDMITVENRLCED